MLKFEATDYLKKNYPHIDPMELMGFIPLFLSPDDPRGAVEQIDINYAHGGGWHRYDGFVMFRSDGMLRHRGDPDLRPLTVAKLRDETIYFYDHAWVCVVSGDGSYQVARID